MGEGGGIEIRVVSPSHVLEKALQGESNTRLHVHMLEERGGELFVGNGT